MKKSIVLFVLLILFACNKNPCHSKFQTRVRCWYENNYYVEYSFNKGKIFTWKKMYHCFLLGSIHWYGHLPNEKHIPIGIDYSQACSTAKYLTPDKIISYNKAQDSIWNYYLKHKTDFDHKYESNENPIKLFCH
jgi:hypothetical protein